MNDDQILRLFFARAESAIDALAKKYGQCLHHLSMNILSDTQDAEECVNDTYLAAWNAIPPARPDPLLTYVCKICRNLSLKRLRSRTAQKRSGYEVSLDELAECICAESKPDARELGQAINRYLDTLPKESRILFLRRHWFGDSLKDISRLMGLRQNTVSVRLSRIRADLKEYLTKEGFL